LRTDTDVKAVSYLSVLLLTRVLCFVQKAREMNVCVRNSETTEPILFRA
jgi:hypothetical protein